jgi:hypothetical protein
MAEPQPEPSPRSPYWPLLALLVLAVGAGAAYYRFVHVPARTDYFVESHLRDLAVVAQQLESDVATRFDAAERLMEQLGPVSAWTIRQDEEIPKPLRDRVKSIGLSPRWCDSRVPGRLPALTIAPHAALADESSAPLRAGSTTTPGWRSETVDSTMEIGVADHQCWTARLGDLIAPRLDANEVGDDDFFVARAGTGEVLYLRVREGLRIASLPVAAGSARERCDGETSDAGAHDLTATTAVVHLCLGGRPYRLFSHPIHAVSGDPWVVGVLIPAREFEERVHAVSLGSLVYWPMLLVLVAVASPLLKIATMGPWDRLRRWDVRILIVSLVLMLGGVTAFLASLYCGASLDHQLDEDLATVSRKMRTHVEAEITQVSRALDRFVDGWARPRAVAGTKLQPSRIASMFSAPRREDAVISGSVDAVQYLGDDVALRQLLGRLEEDYPFPALLYWADIDGQQIDKWTPQRGTTPLISVKDTAAFQDAKYGRLWGWPRGSGPPAAFAFQVRTSKNTGAVLSSLAVPIRDGDRMLGVAAMVPQLISLEHPVLPTDVTFAVIENDGRVVFHSSPSRRLRENLFEESNAAGPIRSVIEASGEALLAGSYRGRAVHFYVSPIAHSPWTLVVMRDREAQRSERLDVILTWAVAFAGYVGLLVLALLLPVWPWTLQWVWPRPDKLVAYRNVSFVLLVGILVAGGLMSATGRISGPLAIAGVLVVTGLGFSYAAYRCLPEPDDAREHAGGAPVPAGIPHRLMRMGDSWRAWFLLGIVGTIALALPNGLATPLFSVVAGVGLANYVRMWRRRRETATADAWHGDYVLFGALLLIILSVLPSLALWQDSWALGAESFIRRGQLKLAERIETLRRATDYEYRVQSGIDSAEMIGKRQQGRLRDDPTDESAEIVTASLFGKLVDQGTAQSEGRCLIAPDGMGVHAASLMGSLCGTGLHSPMCRTLSDHPSAVPMSLLPIYQDESIQLRQLLGRQATDERWTWSSTGGKAELCWYPLPVDGQSERRLATSIRSEVDVPTAPRPERLADVLAIAAVALLLVFVLLLVVRWLAERIFGLGRVHAPPTVGGDEKQFARGVFAVAALGPCSLPTGDPVCLDLRDPALVLDPGSIRDRISSARSVLVTHLDDRILARPDQPALLQVLEMLVFASQKPLVLLSAVDPLLLLREQQAEATDGVTKDWGRWAHVLEPLYLLPPGTQAPAVNELLDRARALCAAAASGALPAPARAAWTDEQRQRVARECLWTPRLRGIGDEMCTFDLPRADCGSQVLDAARAHYRVLWSRLTRDEQLVLAQLSREGLVNPRRWTTAESLAAQGMIRLLPRPQLMNESFRRFVVDEEHVAQQWERSAAASPWNRMSNVVFVAGIAGAVLLYMTQPEGWGSLLALVTAASGVTTKAADLLQVARKLVTPGTAAQT